MPVRITCPRCHSDLRLPEDLYEGPAQCPLCQQAFAIVWHPRQARRQPQRKSPKETKEKEE